MSTVRLNAGNLYRCDFKHCTTCMRFLRLGSVFFGVVHTVSTPNIGPLQTLDQDLRPQQKNLADPTNMFKRPNVLCCYGRSSILFDVVQYSVLLPYANIATHRDPCSACCQETLLVSQQHQQKHSARKAAYSTPFAPGLSNGEIIPKVLPRTLATTCLVTWADRMRQYRV